MNRSTDSSLRFSAPLHLLVVDDEELLREVTVMLLEEAGATCESASSGAEAIALFEKDPSRFHLSVVDFSMPEMSGLELVLTLRKLREGFPAMIVSGLRMIPEVERLVQEGKLEFLSKPYSEAALISGIERCIRGR